MGIGDELRKKSIHDLRVMAQAFGINDIFEKDANHLVQEIELKQQNICKPALPDLPPKPDYDARLMTKPPSRRSSPIEVTELLKPYITLGLKVRLDEERWYFSFANKTDEGTLRMPLRTVLECAAKVMR